MEVKTGQPIRILLNVKCRLRRYHCLRGTTNSKWSRTILRAGLSCTLQSAFPQAVLCPACPQRALPRGRRRSTVPLPVLLVDVAPGRFTVATVSAGVLHITTVKQCMSACLVRSHPLPQDVLDAGVSQLLFELRGARTGKFHFLAASFRSSSCAINDALPAVKLVVRGKN